MINCFPIYSSLNTLLARITQKNKANLLCNHENSENAFNATASRHKKSTETKLNSPIAQVRDNKPAIGLASMRQHPAPVKHDISNKQIHKSIPKDIFIKYFFSVIKKIAAYPTPSFKSGRYAFFTFLFFFLSVFSLSGCLRHEAETSTGAKIFTSGDLLLNKQKNVPRSLYIDAHGVGGSSLQIPASLNAKTDEANFRIVNSPSDAGYILHVTILHEGQTNEEKLAQMVASGYDSHVKSTGEGAYGMLADALLVQRRVPSGKGELASHLKKVSSRNALESSQIRIGILSATDDPKIAYELLMQNLLKILQQSLVDK